MRASVRWPTLAAGSALLATPAAAHGSGGTSTGLAFHLVVAGVVASSLLGGSLVLAVTGRVPARPLRGATVPLLLVVLGGTALAVAVARAPAAALVGIVGGVGVVRWRRGVAVTDRGACAEATLGVVTLHRTLEGAALAAVYATNLALGLAGALVIGVHAAAETAAVGALYAVTDRRRALGAVVAVQAGFVLGTGVGWTLVDAVPTVVRATVLALVGSGLLAVGVREAGRHDAATAEPTRA